MRCQLAGHRPEFRWQPSRVIHNLFTGRMNTVELPPDAAEVVLEGIRLGTVYWSMSEGPMVNIMIELSALPLVREWTVEFGGAFYPGSPDLSI
jgi:hypothetical protein